MPLEVYADGSCFGNGRARVRSIGFVHVRWPEPRAQATGGIGVYFADGDKRNVSEPLAVTDENHATNNRAEITAIIRALEVIDATEPPSRPVVIKSDSVRACSFEGRHAPAARGTLQLHGFLS